MDNYPVHTCEETIGKLEGIGITPHIVPGGCTSYCQPLDVGVNKPFKDRVKGRWMDWVMNGDITQPIIKNPDRQMVAQWVADVWEDFSPQIVYNSWRKTDYDYYGDEN